MIGHGQTTSDECHLGQTNLEKSLKTKLKSGDIVFIGSYLTSYFRPGTEVASRTVGRARENYSKELIDVAESQVNKGAKVGIYFNGPRFNGLEGTREGYCFPQWLKTNLDPNYKISAPSFVEPRRKGFAALLNGADGSRRGILDGVTP